MRPEISFIGAGKMVSAMVSSLIRSEIYIPDQIACCSAKDGTSETLSTATGIQRFEGVDEMLKQKPDLLILGCKPQQLSELPPSTLESTEDCLVLSIMAGITLSRLEQSFPKSRNIVRSMPNTPGQIGQGVTGYLFLQEANEKDKEVISKVLSSLGITYLLSEESDIDKVTAISGSGPAYLFEFACALEEAGVGIGLEPKIAKNLAIQTIIGSARLMEASDSHPEELRNQVTSPNGTTQAALESFSSDKLREIVQRAALAARNRSRELSNA